MFSHFFIARPIFAMVLSIVVVVVGGVSLLGLPVAQYPDVAPPTINVTAVYPGANAVTVAETVATTIEQQVNGVERMLYMSSRCTNDGVMSLDVTFELGTDLNMAQVLVQNRVAIAQSSLPDEVKRVGVTTRKKSPSILLMVNLTSPDGRYDQVYMSNFATLNVKDSIARIAGVGDVQLLGGRDYSMRVWLDPQRLASLSMTVSDVVKAIQEQNVQVAAGRLGQPPVPQDVSIAFDIPLRAQGRLTAPDQFGDIVVKTGASGQSVYLRDLVRETTRDTRGIVTSSGIELGAKNYEMNCTLDGKPSVGIACFQMPGSNALDTAAAIRAKMEELKGRFPPGMDYQIVYDTTVFVQESIASVVQTLFEAFMLVFAVTLLFLQNWRTTVIPMVAVPVSLIGTFAIMSAMGFSLNNLSLFGLVLAIGVVVDDAIVVVENVERLMAKGMGPKDAARKAMGEVTGAIIATSLVVVAVFVPTAFMAGISGQFYRQFALTIAFSTAISAFNSLTLSPALCGLILKPHDPHAAHHRSQALPALGVAAVFAVLVHEFLGERIEHLLHLDPAPSWLPWAVMGGAAVLGLALSRPVNWALGLFFRGFNWVFDRVILLYGAVVGTMLRIAVVALVGYAALLGWTGQTFLSVPTGFVPMQDKGYLVVNAQLPPGATLARSSAVVAQLEQMARATEGVAHVIGLPGYSPLLSTNLSNVGGMFVVLAPFAERAGNPELGAKEVRNRLLARFGTVHEAQVGVFGAPPVEGIGSTAGIKLQVQDRRSAGLRTLEEGVQELGAAAMADPAYAMAFTSFSTAQPQYRIDIDREKAKAQRVALDDVNRALQAYLGSLYVNDFSFMDRNWQVNLQADPSQRMRTEDLLRIEVRNADGQRVPLSTLVKIEESSGPPVVNHYNLYPSAELNVIAAPGTSSSESIARMDQLASGTLPEVLGMEWTELSLQEILASEDLLTKLVFPLAILFVFLVLAAQYESWSLPLAILLIVPMCILASLQGIKLVGLDNNIFVQIGLIVLIALAAKNAILIVEFAKQLQEQGMPRREATVEACRLRLRPILMTAFSFLLGVVPLMLAKGAGAEMRAILGIAVFSGMLGVTVFGLFFTPVFYYVIRWWVERGQPAAPAETSGAAPTPTQPPVPPAEAHPAD